MAYIIRESTRIDTKQILISKKNGNKKPIPIRLSICLFHNGSSNQKHTKDRKFKIQNFKNFCRHPIYSSTIFANFKESPMPFPFYSRSVLCDACNFEVYPNKARKRIANLGMSRAGIKFLSTYVAM